jgi:hypothetical protein
MPATDTPEEPGSPRQNPTPVPKTSMRSPDRLTPLAAPAGSVGGLAGRPPLPADTSATRPSPPAVLPAGPAHASPQQQPPLKQQQQQQPQQQQEEQGMGQLESQRQLRLVTLLVDRGRHRDALSLLQPLVAQRPASAELLCWQGRCLAAIGSRPQVRDGGSMTCEVWRGGEVGGRGQSHAHMPCTAWLGLGTSG